MKILMCTHRMGIGGAETHILTLASELVRQGHSVSVASAYGEYVPALEKAGISHYALPLDKRDPVSILHSVKTLSKLAKDADIVHAHGRNAAFICSLLRKKAGFPPLVTTAHGIYGLSEPKKSLTSWGDGVIAVSEQVKTHLCEKYGIKESSLTLIPNGVDIPPKALRGNADPVCITFSGRMDRDTLADFETLISVFAELRGERAGIQLRIAGDGPEYGKISAACRALNAKYPDCVRLYGRVTDIYSFLDGCDIFAGQSRSALEALAAGIPTVIYSDAGCEGLFCEANAERLLSRNYIPEAGPGSAEKLKNELLRLIENEELRRSAGEYGRLFVTYHNGVGDVAKETLDFYRYTIARKRPGVTLCGYFGAGNLGDEASLKKTVDEIRRKTPPAKIYVITRTPASVPEGCFGAGRFDARGIKRALDSSALFILCGGSLIQNSTSNRSLYYYSKITETAFRHGCEIRIHGGGIGPLRGRWAERKASRILSLSSISALRDQQSLEIAKALGGKAFLSADILCGPAESLPSSDSETGLAVFPRSFRGAPKDYARKLSDAVSQLCRGRGLSPLFIAMAPCDLKLCRRLAKACNGRIETPKNAENVYTSLNSTAFCISVRLHGAVLAANLGIPSICIEYDPKIKAFADSFALPCLKPEDISCDSFVRATETFPGSDDILSAAEAAADRKRNDSVISDGFSFLKYNTGDIK